MGLKMSRNAMNSKAGFWIVMPVFLCRDIMVPASFRPGKSEQTESEQGRSVFYESG